MPGEVVPVGALTFPFRENCFTPSWKRLRSFSSLNELRSTAMIANFVGIRPSWERSKRTALVCARSGHPAPPKITKMVGDIVHVCSLFLPFRVKRAFGIDPLIGVGSEIIALGLDRDSPAARRCDSCRDKPAKPSDRARHRYFACAAYHLAQIFLMLHDLARQVGIQQQIGRSRLARNAAQMSSNSAARMMQPPRQMRATASRSR